MRPAAEMESMAHEVFERLPKGFRALMLGRDLRFDYFRYLRGGSMNGGRERFDLLGPVSGHQPAVPQAMTTSPVARIWSCSTAADPDTGLT